MQKIRAPRNRTITIDENEAGALLKETITLSSKCNVNDLDSKIIHQSLFDCIHLLPDSFIDLLIIDPPYNLSKIYSETKFSKTTPEKYELWLESWVKDLVRCLKPTASIYVCCDWQSSLSIQTVLQKYFKIKNRITWEREKGRGAASNWKNCSEDIWFCTMSDNYYFNVDAVKVKKKVLATYTDKAGEPKDWAKSDDGNFRMTYPSNLWTDISIPFWSMPENTDHPTQKPEKLIAKLILASSKEGDFVFDPFLGSGTTCAVAKKLNRKFSGIEMESKYCQLGVKRLNVADTNKTIQGYTDGVFLDRNLTVNKAKSNNTTVSNLFAQ